MYMFILIHIDTCTYTYTYIHIYIYTYIHIYIYTYIHIYIYIYGCLFVCLIVWLFVCLFVCWLVCLFACLLVCFFVCLFVCLFIPWASKPFIPRQPCFESDFAEKPGRPKNTGYFGWWLLEPGMSMSRKHGCHTPHTKMLFHLIKCSNVTAATTSTTAKGTCNSFVFHKVSFQQRIQVLIKTTQIWVWCTLKLFS